MCGIIGYVGGRPCRELILTGLERLEYRGYDSAGFALLAEDQGIVESVRAVGNLSQLREVAHPLGINFMSLGMTPDWTRADMPMMPKGRYRIMTGYMPKAGTHGIDEVMTAERLDARKQIWAPGTGVRTSHSRVIVNSTPRDPGAAP